MIRGAFGSGIASHIAPNLWQGGFPVNPMGLDGKFDMIVLCARELQPDRIADADTFPAVVEIVCAPMDDADLSAEEAETAIAAAKVVVRALRSGKSVISTCALGRNRSGLVSALALVGRYGLTGREAAARVRAKRERALTNPSFSEFLDGIVAGARIR